MNNNEIIAAGGTLEPTPETKFWVTSWHIPGGSDYDHARVVSGFFADEETARRLTHKYDMPPEMASCVAFDERAKKSWNSITESKIKEIFDDRYEQYRHSHPHFDKWMAPETVLEQPINAAIPIGGIQYGQCGITTASEYILINSKVGKFMMYSMPDNTIHYICEHSFAVCDTLKQRGFSGETTGIIDTVDKINHIFKIPDSYL